MQITHAETQIKETTSEIDKLNAKISRRRTRISKKKSQLQIEEDGQTPIRERILQLNEQKKSFKSSKKKLEIVLENENAILVKLRQSVFPSWKEPQDLQEGIYFLCFVFCVDFISFFICLL